MENYFNTRVENATHCMEAVRSLLYDAPQRFDQIQIHLGLTKPQTLSVLQRLEMPGEIYCRDGVWRLTEGAIADRRKRLVSSLEYCL